MITTNDLLRCPFCGSDNVGSESTSMGTGALYRVYITCDACHAVGPTADDPTTAHLKWNARVTQLQDKTVWTEVSYGPNAQTGWRCPRCDLINRPDIDQCPTCQPAVYTDTATPGDDKTQWVVVSGKTMEDYRIGKITQEQWDQAIQEVGNPEETGGREENG